MYGPVFTEQTIRREIRSTDKFRFKFDWEDDKGSLLASALTFATESQSNAEYSVHDIRGKTCISYATHESHLVHRVIARYLARRFRVNPPSREYIVRAVLESLTDSTPMWVVRRDLSAFYETVPTILLKERLLHDTALPNVIRRHLRQIFSTHCDPERGLPRGIGLAAVLAELAMNEFDQEAQSLRGVYRYFRFSDDILVFTYEKPDQVVDCLSKMVANMGMTFNEKKSDVIECAASKTGEPKVVTLDYLGYKFACSNHAYDRKPREVQVSISDRKLAKIKTRVILALREFRKYKKPFLLLRRLQYLSGNYQFERYDPKRNGVYPVYAGIYYNYRHCGVYRPAKAAEYDCRELKALDGFFHSLLWSKASEFHADVSALPSTWRERLRRLSFYHGYHKRFMHRFPKGQIAELAKAWKYHV